MPAFSKVSALRLSQCDERLQAVFNEVIKTYDCTIATGRRNEQQQNEAVRNNKSKTPWPKSKHNTSPSLAVDAAPYDHTIRNINWEDVARLYHFAGYVMRVAEEMGVPLRWGGDWDRDITINDSQDQDFMDLVHFEIVE